MSDTDGRKATRTTVTKPQEAKVIADITVYPDEVLLQVDLGRDGILTPQQAKDLGDALINAAAESMAIEWVGLSGEDLNVRYKA